MEKRVRILIIMSILLTCSCRQMTEDINVLEANPKDDSFNVKSEQRIYVKLSKSFYPGCGHSDYTEIFIPDCEDIEDLSFTVKNITDNSFLEGKVIVKKDTVEFIPNNPLEDKKDFEAKIEYRNINVSRQEGLILPGINTNDKDLRTLRYEWLFTSKDRYSILKILNIFPGMGQANVDTEEPHITIVFNHPLNEETMDFIIMDENFERPEGEWVYFNNVAKFVLNSPLNFDIKYTIMINENLKGENGEYVPTSATKNFIFKTESEEPKDGLNSLFRVEVIEIGNQSACQGKGGVKYYIGLDLNGNGILEVFGEDRENISTTVVCNGEDGEDGEDGKNGYNSQILIVPLAGNETDPENSCEYGGVVLYTGLDNKIINNRLDDNEITSAPAFICNGEQGLKGDIGPEGPQGPAGIPADNISFITLCPDIPAVLYGHREELMMINSNNEIVFHAIYYDKNRKYAFFTKLLENINYKTTDGRSCYFKIEDSQIVY